MPVRTTDQSIGSFETEHYDAIFSDGTKRAVDFIFLTLVRSQEYIETPSGRKIDVGDPWFTPRVGALDLTAEGEFVDVTKDPDFARFARRVPPE